MSAELFIIAEAGVNHNGSLDLAKELAEAARDAGADAVKFQTFKAERLVSAKAAKAAYQLETTDASESQLEMIRKLELDRGMHQALLEHCGEIGIEFLSSPFDEPSADLLDELGVSRFKLGSGELTNAPLIRHVARKGKPLILSTGMSTLEEVRRAVGWFRSETGAPLCLLHCLTEYPAPPEETNLRAMLTLRDEFGLPVGYSDHTLGIEMCVAAAALGASILEKHLTLDRSMPGPDHKASAEPVELGALVHAARKVAAGLGDGVKRPAPSEMKNMAVARKSLVAARALPEGHVLRPGDLAVKRPGDGVPPAELEAVLGKALRKALAEDETLKWDAL